MNLGNFSLNENFGLAQILFAIVLIVGAIGLSSFLKLNLEQDLFVASFRTTIQLILVGYLLRWVLGTDSLAVNLAALLMMSIAAAQAVTSRLKKKNFKIFLAAQAAVILGVWPLGFISAVILFQETTYSKAAFFVPFMGVLLGNALSAISLAFLGLEKIQSENLHEIETFIALGAKTIEACRRLYRDLLRQALTPILNGMTIVGLVSLPGVMAGQLLGGVDPLIAAQMQILIMFLVLMTSMTSALFALIFYHYFFMPAWFINRISQWNFPAGFGRRLALSGPSGSGKSRFLKSMAGLDQESIREEIWILSSFSKVEMAKKHVIYLHQKPLFVPGTVDENFQWPFQFQRYSHQRYDIDLATRYVKALGLEPQVLTKNATTLSGGEAQLVHLIRSLLLEPEILFLDEPTASLDSWRRSLTEAFLNEWLHSNKNRRLVLITHCRFQIQRFCTDLLSLKDGKMTFERLPSHF